MPFGKRKLISVAIPVTASTRVTSRENTPFVLSASPEPMYLAHSTWELTIKVVPAAIQIIWNGEYSPIVLMASGPRKLLPIRPSAILFSPLKSRRKTCAGRIRKNSREIYAPLDSLIESLMSPPNAVIVFNRSIVSHSRKDCKH